MSPVHHSASTASLSPPISRDSTQRHPDHDPGEITVGDHYLVRSADRDREDPFGVRLVLPHEIEVATNFFR